MHRTVKNGVAAFLGALWGDGDGLVRLRTLRGPARGLTFQLDLRDRLEYAYWLGKYDRPILERLARIIQPGWVAWDCGTYLGLYTCFFARLVGSAGRVVAVEPDTANLARTRRDVMLNGLTNVTFEHAAIGASAPALEFIVSKNTNSHLPGVYNGATRAEYAQFERVDAVVQVKGLSLDEACFDAGLPTPNLIKLDIEGAEAVALRYTDRLCRSVRPVFVLELHNGECDQAAWDWSRAQGYQIEDVVTGRVMTSREQVGGTLLATPAPS